jgi:hypothetical protein
MKIIDLLNKIAKNEDFPKYIMVIFDDEVEVPEYEWDVEEKIYKIMGDNFVWKNELTFYPYMLNYRVIPIDKKMNCEYKQKLIDEEILKGEE